MQSSLIPGFPHYLIFEDGRIWSERKKAFMRSATDEKGYVRQPLRNAANKPITRSIHRLVAITFIPNPENLRDVDHIDGRPSNNNVGNLRWVTHKDNIRLAMLRRGNWLAGYPKRTVAIIRIDPRTREETRFDSLRAACDAINAATVANGGIARDTQLFAGNLCHARNHLKLAYGFYWFSPRRRLAMAMIRAKVRQG